METKSVRLSRRTYLSIFIVIMKVSKSVISLGLALLFLISAIAGYILFVVNKKSAVKNEQIMLVAENGKAIKFVESDVRERFRGTLGVKGINLSGNVKLTSILKPSGGEIITVTENGYGNRVSVDNYNIQKRGGVGVIGIKTSKRNGKVVGAVNVAENDQIIMITNKGKTIKIAVNDMPIIGRNTQGVRLQVLQDDEKLVAISTETIVNDE